MNIAISGATGFIGTHLTTYFNAKGHTVIPLRHAMFRDEMDGQLSQILSNVDVVINLAGASINHRWSKAYMQELIHSRIDVTSKLIKALHQVSHKPNLFISVSAVGYYPNDKVYDETTAKKGDSFLADICHLWENEAQKCPSDIRLVITRLGVVLASDGGALLNMLEPIKRFKIAGIVSPGTQYISWVDIQDVCSSMEFIITHTDVTGVVNLVAPEQVTNRDFTNALAKTFRAMLVVKVPQWVFHLMLGKGASVLIDNVQVYPKRMLDLGYEFKTSTITDFFKTIKS